MNQPSILLIMLELLRVPHPHLWKWPTPFHQSSWATWFFTWLRWAFWNGVGDFPCVILGDCQHQEISRIMCFLPVCLSGVLASLLVHTWTCSGVASALLCLCRFFDNCISLPVPPRSRWFAWAFSASVSLTWSLHLNVSGWASHPPSSQEALLSEYYAKSPSIHQDVILANFYQQWFAPFVFFVFFITELWTLTLTEVNYCSLDFHLGSSVTSWMSHLVALGGIFSWGGSLLFQIFSVCR